MELLSEIQEAIEFCKMLSQELTPQYKEAAQELRDLIKKQTSTLTELLLQFNKFVNLDFDDEKLRKEWATDYSSRADGLLRIIFNDFEESRSNIHKSLNGGLRKFLATKKEKYNNASELLFSIFDIKREVYSYLINTHSPLSTIAYQISRDSISQNEFNDIKNKTLENVKEISEFIKELAKLDVAFAKVTR